MSNYDPDAFHAFEAAGWATKDVAAYESLAGRVTSRLADSLLTAVGARPGMRLLDVATGPGYVAARAAELGADAAGVDFSPTMLEHARSNFPQVEFVHGDAMDLPFPDESFDAVVAAFLLLHLGRPDRGVAEAVRVLVSGGRAAFTVWDEPSRGRWLGVILEAIAAAGAEPPADLPPGPPIFLFADETTFSQLLTDAGLVDVDIETVEFMLRLESGDELWYGMAEGSVRVRPMIQRQSEDMQRRIRKRFDILLDEYRAAGGFDVPVAVKLASGVRA